MYTTIVCISCVCVFEMHSIVQFMSDYVCELWALARCDTSPHIRISTIELILLALSLSLSRKLRDDVPNKLHILSSHGVKHKYMLIRFVHKHKYVAVRASVRFDTHMTTKIFGFISSQHYWSLHFSNNIAEPNIPRLKGFGPATSRGGGRDNYAQIPSTRRECAVKKTCYICDLLRLICLLGAVHFEIEVICHVSQFVLGVLIYASIVSARPQLFSLSLKNFDE